MAELFRSGKICAVVAERSVAAMIAAMRRALRMSRTVELRLDWLGSEREIERMIRWLGANRGRLRIGSRVSLIFTCRRREAGGEFRGGVGREVQLLRKVAMVCSAVAGGAKLHEDAGLKARRYKRPGVSSAELWMDLEMESAAKMSRGEIRELRRGARVLVSYHDFRRTPANLRAVVRRLEGVGGDAIKIAAQARGLRDALRILETARAGRRVVAVPMGDAAGAARILALRAGSALAYAPVGAATAPGQISLEEMTSLYRAERLTRRTRVYAVIGDPIGHSLSPQLQNAGFQARGMDAVYVPILVRDLRDFLGGDWAFGDCGI